MSWLPWAKTDKRLQEATQEDWFWGRGTTSGTEEDRHWRRLGSDFAPKDVIPSVYLDLHHQCYEAYNANPMASAVIEMGVNFVLGDGLQVHAKQPKTQKILDAFWRDPGNRMNLRQFDLVTELSLYGELFIRFFVADNGAVQIRHIDPARVDILKTDPEDIETLLAIHVKPYPAETGADRDAGAVDDGQWLQVPDQVLHFAINKVTGARRGKSDLATLLPWLRRYKDWLLDRVRVNKFKSAFLWDVKLSGADRHTIETKAMEYARPPEPGSVLVHNDSEEWTAVQPQIAADDVSADGHAIKLMIAMGAGLPEHYLSDGGDVNRATAMAMSLPVLKKYQRRQDLVKIMLRTILDRVIAEQQKLGRLGRTVDTSYEIQFPTLQPEDATDMGAASLAMAQAVQIALESGVISPESATKLFLTATREELDPEEELTRIKATPYHPPAPPAAASTSHAEGAPANG